jgi:hypothetical protein
MAIVACELPAKTVIDRELVDSAFFIDSYRVPLPLNGSVIDIFFAVFGHHPAWLKAILLVRHRVGGWFGLRAASTPQIMAPTRAETYRVGESIGPWRIHFLGDEELVAGGDDKHLDFRLSVRKENIGQTAYAFVSTVCRAHNRFGRIYLTSIAPFHKWGVKRLLWRAVQAGRL